MSQRARILLVRQKTNCKTQTTIFAKSTVSGLQVPSPSGTRVAKTPHIACRDSFRKPGPSYPALFFPCSPARDRFALRRRSLLPKAFAPAATWTRLCLRSSRTGGWLHSRYRETSTYPYLFSEETGSALSRGGIWARLLRPLATMGSHLTAGSGWNRASRFAFRMPCRRAASRT